MIAAIFASGGGTLDLGRRLGVSDSDAQILYFSAGLLLALALTIVTTYYAWQNRRMVEELRLQRAEMRQQLAEMRRQTQLGFYRPRLAVLRGVRRAIGHAARDGSVPGETLSDLLRATSEKEFLLNSDLCEYLDEIYRKCVKAYTLRKQLEGVPVGDRRTRLVNEESELLGWILEQPAILRAKFKPYLNVEAVPAEGG